MIFFLCSAAGETGEARRVSSETSEFCDYRVVTETQRRPLHEDAWHERDEFGRLGPVTLAFVPCCSFFSCITFVPIFQIFNILYYIEYITFLGRPCLA